MTARADRVQAVGSGPAPVQALARGLDILSQFTAESPSLSLAELGRRTGLNPATVYRFVKTLQSRAFLIQDADTGHYRVGPAFAVALLALGGNSVFARILEQDLWQLAEETGEGASLAVRSGDRMLMTNVIPRSSGFANVIPAHSEWPLSATWSVQIRVCLAYADEDTRRRALSAPAVRYTERTVTDPKALDALLAKTADEGIAYSCEERSKGRAAVAVPIFSKGSFVGALALHIPPERFDDAHLEGYVEKLRSAAAAMGRRLDDEFTQGAPLE